MNDIRVCLIETIRPDGIKFGTPLNVLYLASYLTEQDIVSRNNIQVLQTDFDLVLLAIAHQKPHIIGFSAVTPNYTYAKKLALQIRKISDAPIILGGQHISGLPMTLHYPFDIGVIGEGEQTLAELIQFYQGKKYQNATLEKIKGIVFLRNKHPVITPQRPLIATEDIPKIDYSYVAKECIIYHTTILDEDKPISVKMASIYSARGCPYHCRFCAHQIIWGNRSSLRLLNIKKVVDEIEFLYERYDINCINFRDDTFAVSKARIRELIKELKNRNLLGKICFDNVFGRANLIDDEFVILLKTLGVKSIFFGIDSGSKRILDYLKNGSLKTTDVKKAVLLCGKYKLWVIGSFMLFSPHETLYDIKKTFRLAQWFSTNKYAQRLNYCVTTPYPGTPLWDDATQDNTLRVKGRPWRDFVMKKEHQFLKPFFKMSFSESQQEHIYNDFKRLALDVQRRKEGIPDWKSLEASSQQKNNSMRNLFFSKIYTKYRWYKFLNFPLRSLKRIVHKPSHIKFIIGDILPSVFHNKKL